MLPVIGAHVKNVDLNELQKKSKIINRRISYYTPVRDLVSLNQKIKSKTIQSDFQTLPQQQETETDT